jgi:hypothetical protein
MAVYVDDMRARREQPQPMSDFTLSEALSKAHAYMSQLDVDAERAGVSKVPSVTRALLAHIAQLEQQHDKDWRLSLNQDENIKALTARVLELEQQLAEVTKERDRQILLIAEGLKREIEKDRQLAEARRDQWRPIETAPKDGTEIWAFNGEQQRMRFFSSPEWSGWIHSEELLADVDPLPERPTYWMPLPAAPAIDAALEGEKNDR